MARVISAIIFLPILFTAVWADSPIWFSALAGVGIMLGLVEYYALVKPEGGIRSQVPALAAAAAMLLASYQQRLELVAMFLAVLAIVELLTQLFVNADREDLSHVLSAAAVKIFGVVYVALLGSYIISLRVIESGIPQLAPKLLTLFFIIVFAGDTGAYYTGRAIGKKKLAPRISPGKTVEGVVGGLAGNLVAVLIAHFTFFPELNLVQALPLALLMGGLGVTGDLCESMLKRGAKAKDAGKLIPGHGGLLDRLDSMLFNAPLLYYFAQMFMK